MLEHRCDYSSLGVGCRYRMRSHTCPPARCRGRRPGDPGRGRRPARPSAPPRPGPDPDDHRYDRPGHGLTARPAQWRRRHASPAPSGGVVDTVTTTTGDRDRRHRRTPIGQTIDHVLGGTLPQLPTGTVDDLLGAAGLNGLNGANGAPASPASRCCRTAPSSSTRARRDDGDRAQPQPDGRAQRQAARCRSPATSRASSRSSGPCKPGAGVEAARPGQEPLAQGDQDPEGRPGLPQRGRAEADDPVLKPRRSATSATATTRAMKLSLVAVDVARNQVTRKMNRVVKH